MSPRRSSSGLSESIATQTLIDQAAAGSRQASEAICQRFRPRLVSWAKGRLPAYARDLMETEDIVQEALVRSLQHISGFQGERGSFLFYVQAAIRNRIRTEIRRIGRRPKRVELQDGIADAGRSPIEEYLGKEEEERYREALAKLDAEEQELVIAKLELHMTPLELASHTGRPSPDAARMAARRAIRKLASLMEEPALPA